MLHPVVAESYYERDNYPGIFSKLFSGSNKNKISKDDHLAVLLKSYDIKSEYMWRIFDLDYGYDDFGEKPLPDKLGRFLKKYCDDDDFEYIKNTIFDSEEDVDLEDEDLEDVDLEDVDLEDVDEIEGSFLTIWDVTSGCGWILLRKG